MAELDHSLQLHPPVVELGGSDAARATPSDNAAADDGSSKAPNVSSTGAIPMSLPSILRNPGLRHLNGVPRNLASSSFSSRLGANPTAARPSRDLSKRKARRADNARLAGNPHVVRPTAADFRLQANPRSSTFPASAFLKTPGSGSKAISLSTPQYGSTRAAEPCYDASSASSGQFRTSLKDARKALSDRINVDRERFGTQGDGPVGRTVWKAEAEIKAWLDETVFVSPDVKQWGGGRVLVDESYRVVDDQEQRIVTEANESQQTQDVAAADTAQVVELQRTPNALVWSIPDPFLRLAVHCLARIYGCPSFSKDASPPLSASPSSAAAASSGQNRHTWILNPNPLARGLRRPRRRSAAADRERDRRRSESVSTSASSRVLGGPGLGPQALRAVQLAGGIETPPTTDLDSRDGGSLRAWNPDEDTDDPGSMSASAASVDQIAVLGRDATITEEVASELSGSDVEEARLVERRVRRWAARHSDVHVAHRLDTPLEASEDDDDDGEAAGDTAVVPPPLGGSTMDAQQDTDEDWERILIPRRASAVAVTPIAADDDAAHGEGDSDWAADHEDASDSFSESDADVASLAESMEALDVQRDGPRQ